MRPPPSAQRRGRRRGQPDTKAAILRAARESFAASGFSGTTIRGVAAVAGVDAALVHHYFGSKDSLFVAALEMPVDPREVLAPVVAAGLDGAGERLLRAFLSVWDDPQVQPALIAVARSAIEPGGDALIRTGFIPVLVGPVIAELVADRAEDRIVLVASQMIGLIVARYLLAIEPLASLRADDVVARIGPTLQRYLADDLG